MNTKICNKCGAELNLSLFTTRQDRKDGHTNECKECHKQYCRDNKEHIAEHKKQYNGDHKEHVAEYKKRYRQDNKEHIAKQTKQYNEDHKKYIAERMKQYQQDNKECIAEQHQHYRQDNKEHIAKYLKQYKETNKESIAEYGKQYCQDHKEYIAEREKQYCQDHKEHIAERIKQYQQDNKEQFCVYSQKRRALKKLLPATFTTNQWKTAKLYFNNRCCYCGKELPFEQEHFIALSKGGGYTVTNIIPSCKSCNDSKHDHDFFIWYPKYKYFSGERELKILDYLKEKEG